MFAALRREIHRAETLWVVAYQIHKLSRPGKGQYGCDRQHPMKRSWYRFPGRDATLKTMPISVSSRKRTFEETNPDEDLFEVGDDEDEEITSEEDDDDDGEEEEVGFEPSEDEEVPYALDQLQNFVSNLDVTAKKRKAPDDSDGGAIEHREPRTRKRLLQEKTEAGEENEFHVRSSGV